MSAFLYVYPWFSMCPSSEWDFKKDIENIKLFHTSCYGLCFLFCPGLDDKLWMIKKIGLNVYKDDIF